MRGLIKIDPIKNSNRNSVGSMNKLRGLKDEF